ncbi:MAG: ABC transporter ATP-binding protein [bacterium]
MSVELRQVVKQVDGDTHIHETDLKLEKGGFNVLLGTTLSGKTTLLRLMAGLELPTSGEIWFEGENVTRVPVQKRSVSMVYQQFINYPNFNVYNNIASPLKVAGTSTVEIKSRVEKIAAMLKLDNLLSRYPSELSGGQQQRIAIARALVKDSKLVLLDEPLANLDYKLREELRDEMPRLFADTGATVVYSTTEPLEALMLGGHTATLYQGRVSQYGVTSDGYRFPDNLTSAKVFSDPPINTADVRKDGERFYLNKNVSWMVPRTLRSLQNDTYTMAIRPHHLLLNADKPGAIRVDAKVKISELSGSESVIHIDVDGNDWVSECHGIHPFDSGDHTSIFMQVDRCLYFDQQQKLIQD